MLTVRNAPSLMIAVLLAGLLAPTGTFAVALYSTLTEAVYLDCVRHVSGEGPAYRVDLELHGGSVRSRSGKIDTGGPQVFVAAKIVEMNDTSLCGLGQDPLFSFHDGMVRLEISQVAVAGNSGEHLGTATVRLESGSDLNFVIENLSLVPEDEVIPDSRPQIVIDQFLPYVRHRSFASDLGACLNVRPTVPVEGPIHLEVRVAMTDGPAGPDSLMSLASFDIPTAGTTVLGGLTEIARYGEYHAVPLLGEIPMLGYLFRFDGDRSSRTELLIQVTPQTLRCGDG